MIKKLLFLTLLLFPSLAWADSQLLYQATDTRDGMNSHDFPSKILNTQVQDALNVFLNDKSGQVRRAGIKVVASTAAYKSKAMWDFFGPSNNEWLIRLDSAGYLRAGQQVDAGGGTFSVVIATLSSSVNSDATSCLGEFWITNKSDGLISWDESTLTRYPNAPFAARVECFKNRIVLADINNRQSSVDFSGNEDGSDWNNDARFSTSPFSVPIGGVNDGNKVHEIKVGVDELVVLKAFSTHAIGIPSGQNDYFVRDISSKLGTIYPESVDQYNGATIFISNRGLDSYYPPATFQQMPLSQNVQNLVDSLADSQFTGKNTIITSLGQWQQGVSSPTGNISTSLSSGSITPENHTFIDTNGSDWGRGTITNNGVSILSTGTTPGSLVFVSTRQAVVVNGSFEDAGSISTSAVSWDVVENTNGDSGCTEGLFRSAFSGAYDGSFKMMAQLCYSQALGVLTTNYAEFVIFDLNNNVLLRQTLTVGTTGQNDPALGNKRTTVDVSASSGTQIKVGISQTMIGPSGKFTNSTMTQTMAAYGSIDVVCVSSVNQVLAGPRFGNTLYIDLVRTTARPQSDFRSFYTSRVFDTVISSPIYDPLRVTFVSSTATFALRTSSAPDCCFGADIALTSGSVPTNERKKYFVYVASFSVTPTSGSQTIELTDISLGSYATGYFQTAAVDVGQAITSWGLFTANQSLDDGQISYQLNSSTWTQFSESGWTSQTLNTIIGVPVRRYVAARMIFQAQASTDNPIVTDLTFNWNDGETEAIPVARTFSENFYLFFSTAINQSTTNDSMLVWEKGRGLSFHSGITAGAATVHLNKFYIGDSSATGNVYELNASTDGTDNGTPIVSYVTYRRIDAGKEESDKVLDKCYFTVSRNDTSASQIFDVDYFVDGSTYTVASSMVEISTGVSVAVLKSQTSVANEVRGKFFDVRIKERGTSKGYSIQSFKAYGTIIEPD